MSDFDFLKGLALFYKSAKNTDSNSTEEFNCESSINHYTFYQCCLAPAFVLTLLMAATNPRKQKFLAVLNGRPGLIYPMDTLTRSSRISYSCAFGATGFLVYQVLINGQFAIEYTGTLAVKTFIAIVSMLIYGMVFFPLFTSLALATGFSYCLGSLYVWVFFVVQLYKITECDFNDIGRAVLFTRALPSLICLAYLSIYMPVRCCITIYHKKYFTPSFGDDPRNETIEEIKNSYQGKHVINLLKKPEVIKLPEGLVNSVKSRLMGILGEWIYHNHSGFRYPARLLSVMFVSGCVVYVIGFQLLSSIVPTLNHAQKILQEALDDLGPVDQNESTLTSINRNTIIIVLFFIEVINVSLIVSVVVSSVITIINILHMISTYRTNLFAIYRGDYSNIPPPSKMSAISLCTGSIKYAGFQVGYIVWGFVLILLILFLVCFILAAIITVLIFGITDWLVNEVLQLWPGLAVGIALFFIQSLLAKFVFLQNKGEYLRLDNRRFYFIFAYFMFFYNIFLGLISCLLRILKALGLGILFLARLDNSTLPRKFEFLDSGFSAYQGYIHMEAAHTHPVVNVFIRLLIVMSKSRNKQNQVNKEIEMSVMEVVPENGINNTGHTRPRPVNLAARFNWHVTYTLLQNPMVRIYRRGFFQVLQKARKEGLNVPISDSPITDFDIIKIQEMRDKQRTEETSMSSSDHSSVNGLTDIELNQHSDEADKVKDTGEINVTKRPSWFRMWRKRIGNESFVSHDSVSEEYNNTETYLKVQNV